MNEHTPWEANKTDIVNSRGEVILRDAFMTAEIRDLILRAVNAHDELVKALEIIERNYWPEEYGGYRCDLDDEEMATILAALAKAMEKA